MFVEVEKEKEEYFLLFFFFLGLIHAHAYSAQNDDDEEQEEEREREKNNRKQNSEDGQDEECSSSPDLVLVFLDVATVAVLFLSSDSFGNKKGKEYCPLLSKVTFEERHGETLEEVKRKEDKSLNKIWSLIRPWTDLRVSNKYSLALPP